jgi:hypothetical protein
MDQLHKPRGPPRPAKIFGPTAIFGSSSRPGFSLSGRRGSSRRSPRNRQAEGDGLVGPLRLSPAPWHGSPSEREPWHGDRGAPTPGPTGWPLPARPSAPTLDQLRLRTRPRAEPASRPRGVSRDADERAGIATDPGPTDGRGGGRLADPRRADRLGRPRAGRGGTLPGERRRRHRPTGVGRCAHPSRQKLSRPTLAVPLRRATDRRHDSQRAPP